ncbi:MAG TPA: hypothetical protein EYG38_14315 [Verrucomicrobia bacterium]|nr:hypothetical protein [Verrucomicrobiota bacterium]
MSAQEIIEELSNLSKTELEKVEIKVHELLQCIGGKSSLVWGQALLEVAGTAEGLPEDMAVNHDHYLHATPKR